MCLGTGKTVCLRLSSHPRKGSSEARFQSKGRHVAHARLKEDPALYGRQLATMTSHPSLARRQAEPKQYRKRHRDITRTQWSNMNYTVGMGAAIPKNDGMPMAYTSIKNPCTETHFLCITGPGLRRKGTPAPGRFETSNHLLSLKKRTTTCAQALGKSVPKLPSGPKKGFK